MFKRSNKYNDIIDLPHHVSNTHPRMSVYARSAQFAPFVALKGYDDEIKETGRFTNKKIDIDEELKNELNIKLKIITKNIFDRPKLTFIYFIQDERKDGGKYIKVKGSVKKIDEYKKIIVLEDNTKINIYDIVNIEGDIFNILDNQIG